MKQNILVVLVNGDAVAAYPISEQEEKNLHTIREKVRSRVRAEVFAHPNVRLQVVQVDNPTCTGDWQDSLVDDILDKVGG